MLSSGGSLRGLVYLARPRTVALFCLASSRHVPLTSFIRRGVSRIVSDTGFLHFGFVAFVLSIGVPLVLDDSHEAVPAKSPKKGVEQEVSTPLQFFHPQANGLRLRSVHHKAMVRVVQAKAPRNLVGFV